MYEKRKSIEHLLALFSDFVCIIIAFALATYIRFQQWFAIGAGYQTGTILFIICAIYLVLGLLINYYKNFIRRGYFDEALQLVWLEVSVAACLAILMYVLKVGSEFSRAIFGYFFIIHILLAYTGRIVIKNYLLKIYRRSRHSSKMLVVVPRDKCDEVLDNLLKYNEWYRDIEGVALVGDHASAIGELVAHEIKVVATGDNLIDYVTHHKVDEVFITDCIEHNTEQVKTWVKQMRDMGILVDVNIDIFNMVHSGKRTLNRVGKYATVSFARNIYSTRQFIAKRALDLVGSTVGLVILGISYIFVAPLIKFDSKGPVFFVQKRVGKNGEIFDFYKYRSMYIDAEERKAALMKDNEMEGPMFKMKDDPRITKVGKFLRKTSIDELPQFWNVFKGDMSLVGTRPPTEQEFKEYEAAHKCRLAMVPGITGMWQVSGRSNIKEFDDIIKLDMQYIDNWSIWLDIKILFQTVGAVFTGRGSE